MPIRTPQEMRDDALLWARADFPPLAVHRYRDAADQVEYLEAALDWLMAKTWYVGVAQIANAKPAMPPMHLEVIFRDAQVRLLQVLKRQVPAPRDHPDLK